MSAHLPQANPRHLRSFDRWDRMAGCLKVPGEVKTATVCSKHDNKSRRRRIFVQFVIHESLISSSTPCHPSRLVIIPVLTELLKHLKTTPLLSLATRTSAAEDLPLISASTSSLHHLLLLFFFYRTVGWERENQKDRKEIKKKKLNAPPAGLFLICVK